MARGDSASASASASAHRIHSFIPQPLLLPCPRNNKKPPPRASCRLQHTQGNGGRQPGRQSRDSTSTPQAQGETALIFLMHPSVPLRKSQIHSLFPHPTLDQSIHSINRHTCNSMLLVAHLHLHFKLGLVFPSDQLINLSRDHSTVCTNKCS